MITLWSADWVLPVLGEPIRDGALTERDGRILAVGTRRDLAATDHDRERHVDGCIIPGLVNAHTHLQYSQMADLGRGSYTDFPDWAGRFQARFTAPDNDWYAAAREGAEAAIRAGTTAIADVVTAVEALPVITEYGLRGIAYWEVMAWSSRGWAETGRRACEEVLRKHDHLQIGISPHAPYSLDEDVLADLTTLARELGVRRHIHLAESRAELEFIASGTGPQAATLRNWGLSDFALLQRGGSGQRPVAYVEGLGGLGPDCHIAHGIYVDADDRALLRRNGTAVALCPRSNAVIGLDEVPIADYLRERNPIAVGTDSLSSAPSLDLLADVALLAEIAERQGYHEDDLDARLLTAATLGGAQAMGLDTDDHPAGALQPGWACDLALVERTGSSAGEVLRAVVRDGAGAVSGTVVGGRPLTFGQ